MSNFWKTATSSALALTIGLNVATTQARILLDFDSPSGSQAETFVLDLNNDATESVNLQFGEAFTSTFKYKISDNKFELNRGLDIEGELSVAYGLPATDSDGALNLGINNLQWEQLYYDATYYNRFELSDDIIVDGAVISDEIEKNTASGIYLDWSDGNQQSVTLNQAGHSISFSNYEAGQNLRLILCQDEVGSQTISTWPGIVKWENGTTPVLTTTPNKCDVVSFLSTNERGSLEVFGVVHTDF